MTAVGITENVKGDSKKFEIWYNAREEVYIVQVGWGLGRRPWALEGTVQERCSIHWGSVLSMRPWPVPQGLTRLGLNAEHPAPPWGCCPAVTSVWPWGGTPWPGSSVTLMLVT